MTCATAHFSGACSDKRPCVTYHQGQSIKRNCTRCSRHSRMSYVKDHRAACPLSPYQLVHAAEMVRDTFEQFYQQRYQLTVPQWRLMMVLGPNYPISQKELVEASGMDKVRISAKFTGWWRKGSCSPRAASTTSGSVWSPSPRRAHPVPAAQDRSGQLAAHPHRLPASTEARQSIRLHLQSVSDAIEQLHLLDSERPS